MTYSGTAQRRRPGRARPALPGYSASVRILIVHHHTLPAPGRACTGGALRAFAHGESLKKAGHTVGYITRAQDDPAHGFRSPAHLQQLASAFGPDWILCVAPGEAPALAPVAPLMVDLYAPRLLEAAFEDLQAEEAGRSLQAVHVADEVLFSNPRQRWFWLGILGMCGWDLSRPAGLLVPLCTPANPPPRARPDTPTFLLGGSPWPWQDPSDTLRRAVAHLDGRGQVEVWGLSPVEGVVHRSVNAHDAWLTACAGATAALDRYAPNPERQLALGFRQLDYLGCGLPLISSPDGVLADELRETGAGWVDEPLEEAMDAAMREDRTAQVLALAQRYHRDVTEAPVVAWSPRRREKGWSALRDAARFAVARETAKRTRAAAREMQAEVRAKRAEIRQLNEQIRALTIAVERMAIAQHEVAGFRRETVQVLGARLQGQTEESEHLRREIEVLKADLEKKSQEIARAQTERTRLEQFIQRLRGSK